MLEVYFFRMKGELQMLGKELTNRGDSVFEILIIVMDENKIIDISSIISDFESFFYKNIKLMKIEICKNLTRKIADGKSCVRRRKEETF